MTNATPVAVDPSYKMRDNQFWYSDCTFAKLIRGKRRITLRVEGLGVRTLEHSITGTDGRPTHSFKLPSSADSQWWKANRGQRIRLELLSVDGGPSAEPVAPPQARVSSKYSSFGTPVPPSKTQHRTAASKPASRNTLCIGIDVAWFGGSAGNRDSQYDCVGAVVLSDGLQAPLDLKRVRLINRDPYAKRTLEAILELVTAAAPGTRVVLALDAPIQASPRPQLPERAAALGAGQVGNIERRACENALSEGRQKIDRVAGGTNGWHPNIQAGAPLAQRVERLLAGLRAAGFVLWTPQALNSDRMAIECFPAEAIWAAKRLGGYPCELTPEKAKAYKGLGGTALSGDDVRRRVKSALRGFTNLTGDADNWEDLMAQATTWLLNDGEWRNGGQYRGGKLLDDVVDTMICLASSISYVNQCAHVWRDPAATEDGHIIGPGCAKVVPWVPANPGLGKQ